MLNSIKTNYGTMIVSYNSDGKITNLDFEKKVIDNAFNSDFNDIVFLEELQNDFIEPLYTNYILEGTDFQKQVWNKIKEIKFGETISYQELANRCGVPKSIRAVASACAKNKLAIVIPCHRVIHSSGKYGKYRWGQELKKEIIEMEKVISSFESLSQNEWLSFHKIIQFKDASEPTTEWCKYISTEMYHYMYKKNNSLTYIKMLSPQMSKFK